MTIFFSDARSQLSVGVGIVSMPHVIFLVNDSIMSGVKKPILAFRACANWRREREREEKICDTTHNLNSPEFEIRS